MVDFFTLIDVYRDIPLGIALIMPRFLGIFMITPFLGANLIPAFIRNGIVVGLSLIILPLIIQDIHQYSFTDTYIWMILIKEIFIGLVCGFLVAIFLYAVQSAGFFIDNQRGAAIASTVDPLLGQQTSPLGIFLSQLVVVYFFTSGLFLVFIGALYRSYVLWPIFSFFPDMSFFKTEFFMQQTDLIFFLALMFAGPAIIAMFLSELGLAMISRFAPQLNVFFLSMPVKSGVAMFILVIYMPFLLSYIQNASIIIENIFAVLDGVFR